MQQRATNASYTWILPIALLSGAVCLTYQLIWSRYLHLILGVSAHAVAMVLSGFMLGLALGAWQIGSIIDRVQARVRVLMGMEILIGIYLVISPLLYRAIAGIESRPIQVCLAIASLLPPTYLMGGTFPAFVRVFTRDVGRIGKDAGLIYAGNTLGGAIGALVTGFFLIGQIGLSRTLYLAGSISFLTAGMIAMGLRSAVTGEPPDSRKTRPGPPPTKESFTLIATVFAVCGFTGLAYEVFWTRLLSLFFKDSLYDLTIVLTTYLTGLAAGSVASAYCLRWVKRPRHFLSLVLILIGLSALLGLHLVDRFPYWINHLQTNAAMVERYGSRFWLAGNAIRFWYALLLMFIPTCLFGAVLPIVSRIAVDQIGTMGRRIGLLSGVNTVGSAAGALAAGFVLIGTLGLANSIMLMAFLNILAALLLLRGWFVRGLTLCIWVMLAALVPPWDRVRMSLSFLDPNQRLERHVTQEYYREDIHGITAVVHLPELDVKYLVTNRLFTQNTSEMMGSEDHRRLGHLPMLLHPDPRNALAVGLGAGITLRGMADHTQARIDAVEISPSVVEAARLFTVENARVLENPRVSLIIDDARHVMRTSRKQYDVIVLDIFHPMSGGSSMIFSREYYELARKRLAPGGLLCQWLPAHQLSLDEIQTVAATIQSVFPHVSLWYGLIGPSTAVVGVIASEQPLSIDYPRLAHSVQGHPELRQIGLETPERVLSHFIMADQALRGFVGAAPIDTDDRPIIELAAPRLALRSSAQGIMNLALLSSTMTDVRPYVMNLPEDGGVTSEVEHLRKLIESIPPQRP